jgi:uncharacterized membrane protein YfcA
MDVYLPIANLSVNGLVIVGLGMLTGLLSGMFGVGGGFLTTPLLIFYGIPHGGRRQRRDSGHRRQRFGRDRPWQARRGGLPDGRRFGGRRHHWRGAGFGLVQPAAAAGQIDTVINILYVVMLGSIGGLMAKESIQTMRGASSEAAKRRHHPLVSTLPLRWRFYRSGLYISPLAPLLLGIFTGILTMLMGIGGGFVLVPAMLYILGMSAGVVVGTSLFQILFVTMATTMIHALTTHAVDVVLAALLLLGSVTGAQLGTLFAAKASPVKLRLALAVIVLMVAARMVLGLTWHPDEIFTVSPL